ncbi:MAG: DUF547 domain-containing protein [Acidobacteriota bacterium]|nr:DUF547 domain-containing protein [Acidobacteriota bacterium]
MRVLSTVVALAIAVAALSAQDPPAPPVDPIHKPFDEILDIYVRDGLVYYHALEIERAKFDRSVAAVSAVPASEVTGWSRDRQLAYWINAYNAFVLRTVIDHYPIRGKAADYPANSIRQVSGAFERLTVRAGGRALTLDSLERDVIGGFGDARALLALSRGALGGPRLKSEAFTSHRLNAQLTTMAGELVDHRELVRVDTSNNTLSVSPIFSWREDVFVKSTGGKAPEINASRSPLERAVLTLIDPLLVRSEADFLKHNQFRMVFHDFDWRLNDLTGR